MVMMGLPLPQIPTKAGLICEDVSRSGSMIGRWRRKLEYLHLAFPASRLIKMLDADVAAAMESDGCLSHCCLGLRENSYRSLC